MSALWRGCAWTGLALSGAAYVLVSLAHHQAFYPWGSLNYFDLRVYRGAAQLVLGGQSLYDARIWHGAQFTYPPFAALALTPLALVPLAVDKLLVTGLSLLAVFAILALALRLPAGDDPGGAPAPASRSAALPAAVAAAIWLEPITATLGYGQINLLITLLIVWDLSRPDAARTKGLLIGIAAGIKLTPLIFVPYIFLSGRRRAALTAVGTFGATVALGYTLLAADARRFWGGLFLDPSRVGGCCVPANQSLRGVILGLDPTFGTGRMLLVALSVGVVGVALAVLASRRGDEAAGFSLCALTGLLVSPVSWTHHWALAVPALLLLAGRFARRRSKLGMIALAAILLAGYSYLPKLIEESSLIRASHLAPGMTLASGLYVLIGIAALAAASVREARTLRGKFAATVMTRGAATNNRFERNTRGAPRSAMVSRR